MSHKPAGRPEGVQLRDSLLQFEAVRALVYEGESELAQGVAAIIETEHLRAEALKRALYSASLRSPGGR